jgi:ADP-ribosylglycohydrolase
LKDILKVTNKGGFRLIGTIIGDIIGSAYEHHPTKSVDFALVTPFTKFTDDTVLTVATMDVYLSGKTFTKSYQEYTLNYPLRGYGSSFDRWVRQRETLPYNSFGNGSAMRVSPIGWLFDTADEVLLEAKRSAEVTHNHPEGIKGAQAVALSIFMARKGTTKEEIRNTIAKRFNYDLFHTISEIRPFIKFDVTCQGSVPPAIIAFLDSDSVLDAIKLAVSMGGDCDTQAAIAGGIAEAFYGPVSKKLYDQFIMTYLSPALLESVKAFYKRIDRPLYDSTIITPKDKQ